MKTSFYFVLWIVAYILIGMFGTPVIQKHAFGAALVFVILASILCNKLLSNQIFTLNIREYAKMFELGYNNELDRFRRIFRNKLILEAATFAYLAVALVCIIVLGWTNGMPWFLVCVLGYITYSTAKDVYQAYQRFSFVKSQSEVTFPDKGVQAMYDQYIEIRSSATFEEMCPQIGIKDKMFRVFNLAMSVLASLIGIVSLFTGVMMIGDETHYTIEVMTFLMYGGLALMFGVTDLISTCKGYLKLY